MGTKKLFDLYSDEELKEIKEHWLLDKARIDASPVFDYCRDIDREYERHLCSANLRMLFRHAAWLRNQLIEGQQLQLYGDEPALISDVYRGSFKMDTSHDLKRPKRKSEHGLEKSSQGSIGQKAGELQVDGKCYEMPHDLKDLEEIDYENPGVKKWLEEEKAGSIRRYGRLTAQEAEYMYDRRQELQKKFPNKSAEDLNKIALAEIRDAKRVEISRNS